MREIKFRAWDGSGKYVAGSDGLIYSTNFNHTGKTRALKGDYDKDGYHHVLMNIAGKRVYRRVHRLVALAFHGRPPTPKHQVNHINGTRTDNKPENLEYVTSQENTLHGYQVNGRTHSVKQRLLASSRFKWSANPKAKLNYEQVSEIRHLRNTCKQSLQEVSDLFGVSRSQVSAIATGRNWK
jgi:hypothetical protein